MNELNQGSLSKTLSKSDYPSLSLYMPTHRNHPENSQDTIRYKNLVKQLEAILLTDKSPDQADLLLKPFETLFRDEHFWNHTLDGLAVFGNKNIFEVFMISETVKDLAIVRANFHLRPLRQYLQSPQRYYILGLSINEIQLFEGNRQTLFEIDLPENISKNIQEALGDELTEKHSTVASYGGTSGQSTSMHHGQGGKKEEVGKDAEKFFRIVASEIEDYLSTREQLPLILAALPEHHYLFRKVNKNPAVLEIAIDFNPKSVSREKLADLASAIIEESNKKKYRIIAENYAQAKADNLGSEDIEEIINAVNQGRVSTLLLKDDLFTPAGSFSSFNTPVEIAEKTYQDKEEILESIDEMVISMGGKVIFLPEEQMTCASGYAAIYRY